MPATSEVEAGPVDHPWVVTRDDAVTVIRFEGGQRRTMGISGAAQLASLIDERSTRAEPPVLVLDVSILHAELSEVLEMAAGRPIADWAPWLAAISGLECYPSATIVAVDDQASCGGLELTLAADIRIVAPQARLGVMEAQMGLIPGAGGTQRLPALVGHGWASLLCFSGETISGAEAHRIGLAQLLSDAPQQSALDLAERLAGRGPAVLAAAKQALLAARRTTSEGFRVEGRNFLAAVALPTTADTMRRWLARQAEGDPPAKDPSPLP